MSWKGGGSSWGGQSSWGSGGGGGGGGGGSWGKKEESWQEEKKPQWEDKSSSWGSKGGAKGDAKGSSKGGDSWGSQQSSWGSKGDSKGGSKSDGKGSSKGDDSWDSKPAWGSSKGSKGDAKGDSKGSTKGKAKEEDSWESKPAWGSKGDSKGSAKGDSKGNAKDSKGNSKGDSKGKSDWQSGGSKPDWQSGGSKPDWQAGGSKPDWQAGGSKPDWQSGGNKPDWQAASKGGKADGKGDKKGGDSNVALPKQTSKTVSPVKGKGAPKAEPAAAKPADKGGKGDKSKGADPKAKGSDPKAKGADKGKPADPKAKGTDAKAAGKGAKADPKAAASGVKRPPETAAGGPAKKVATEAPKAGGPPKAKADAKAEAKAAPKAEPKKPEPKPKPEPPKPPPQADIDKALKDAAEKVKAAEAALTVCQDAELPYLRGIEVLEKEEGEKTLKECDEGIKKAEPTMRPTISFIKQKMAEYRKFNAESTTKAVETLTALDKTIEKVNGKYQVFVRETADRKVAAVIAEVSDSVVAAEKKVTTIVETTKDFADAAKVAALSVDDLKASSSKAAELEKEASAACNEARKVVSKVQQDAKNRGPQVKAAVTKLQNRLSTAQSDLTKQRKLIQESGEIIINKECDPEKIMAEVTPKAEACEEAAKKVEEAVEPLKALKDAELEAFATPVTVRDESESLMAKATSIIEDAKTCVKEHQVKVAKVTKGPLVETKKELGKILAKVESCTRKAAAAVKIVNAQCQTLSEMRYKAACDALRGDIQNKGTTADELFKKVGKGNYVKPEAVVKLLDSVEGLSFPEEHKKLLCKHLGAGDITKRAFDQMVKQFLVVVKGTAVTNEFAVNTSKTLRKAEVNEVFEVLEGPRTDEDLGLQRVRAKSLLDGLEGWVAVKGNKGTPFLEECPKPYYVMTKDSALEKDFESGEAMRLLKAEEIFEVVEGPRSHKVENASRAKGKVLPEGKTGWFTVKDTLGAVNAEQSSKFYVCKAAVAITDAIDIKTCKVVRRLAEGEMLFMIEGPEDVDGITRIKVKAVKDGSEGWITTTGNAGTVYAEPTTSKLFTVLKDVELDEKFTGDVNKTVDTVKAGAFIEVSEGPREEKSAPITKFKGRMLSEDATGWIVQKNNMRPWKPSYKCIKATAITKENKADSAEVRQLELNEMVEFLEGPVAGEEKEMKMKGRAMKDGATGWMTILAAAGTQFLKC